MPKNDATGALSRFDARGCSRRRHPREAHSSTASEETPMEVDRGICSAGVIDRKRGRSRSGCLACQQRVISEVTNNQVSFPYSLLVFDLTTAGMSSSAESTAVLWFFQSISVR